MAEVCQKRRDLAHCALQTFKSPLWNDCLAAVTLQGSGLERRSEGSAAAGLEPLLDVALASVSALSFPVMPSCPETQRSLRLVARVPVRTVREELSLSICK